MSILFYATPGVVNNLYFNGTDALVQYDVGAALAASTSVTMEGWVYPLSFSSTGTIFDHGTSSTLNYQLTIDTVGDIWINWYNAGWAQHRWAGSSLVLNEWSHVCGVIKPGESNGNKVYINGNKAGEITNGRTLTYTAGQRLKSGIDRDDSEKFNGYMKNLIVYTDVDVPEATIIAHSNNDYSSVAGADVYWKLDEGQGTTAEDSTANNRDGVIANGTWQIIGG
jgi:hypothetical protein